MTAERTTTVGLGGMIERLPYQEDVERFAPPYTPESFTQEEQRCLRPFFSNVDRPVFVVGHLPEEVIGALSSRYSRSTQSLRRMFLTEYVEPIVRPERQRGWGELDAGQQREAVDTGVKFLEYVDFLNKHGGIDAVVNIQRARGFFDRWLAEYGDDSIAEMGGVHLCLEGLSNVATKEVEDKRIGISPLEKSSRYVSFADRRPDGSHQYLVPGEILGTPLEQEYRQVMDLLFSTYAQLLEPYLDYIKGLYPKGEDETRGSFNSSRSAKRYDDLRDLLPFSTQTNVALFGNGRAFEDLINRLMYHPVGELRWWGQTICRELEQVVPSFVRRPATARGAEVQVYRKMLWELREELARELPEIGETVRPERVPLARLVSFTPEAEVAILSAFRFGGGVGQALSWNMADLRATSPEVRTARLKRILDLRKMGNVDAVRHEVRFRKVHRSFENVHCLFEIWGRGGDYRDLHRHRQATQERQRFTTRWGYDLEREVLASPFADRVRSALARADEVCQKLERISQYVAQYVVPFAFVQHWYMNLAAREVYWMVELRTGPQGRPHYRDICQQIARLAIEASPAVFQGLMVDFNDYSLARRESEKRIEKKLGARRAEKE